MQLGFSFANSNMGGVGIFYVANTFYDLYFYNADTSLNTAVPLATTPFISILGHFILVSQSPYA